MTYRVIDAPHEHAEDRLVRPEQLHLLVLDAKVLLLDHSAIEIHDDEERTAASGSVPAEKRNGLVLVSDNNVRR